MANIFDVIRYIDSGNNNLASRELFTMFGGNVKIEDCKVVAENIHDRYCKHDFFYHIAYKIYKNMKLNYSQDSNISEISANCELNIYNSQRCVEHAIFLFNSRVDNEIVIRSIMMLVETLKEN